jgi:hypothetical protein
MKRFNDRSRVGSCISALVFAGSSSAFASDSLADALNLLLRVSDEHGDQRPNPNDCRELSELVRGAQLAADLARFKKQASELFKKCNATHEEDDDTPTPVPVKAVDSSWDGIPHCGLSDGRLLHCEHNPVTGRGLFALSSTSSPENSPTLVCAHFEASSRSPFDYLQEVASRCVVTEFDWRYEGSRSDVVGLKTWLKSPVGSAALRIPAVLREQCSQVFADSLYCTPTLVVLPERDSAQVTVCSLETRDYRFGFGPVLHVHSLNSRWTCESKSLFIPDKDERLSVAERSCVPDHLGRLMNDYCRLPYMPVSRTPVRTYIP